MKSHSHARRGQAVRKAMLNYIATCPHPPSLREIGEAVGLSSSSTVWSHVRTLREEGKIAPAKLGQPRAILLTDPGPSEVEILRGRVAELEACGWRVVELLRAATDWGPNPSTAGILDALNLLGRCLPEVRQCPC